MCKLCKIRPHLENCDQFRNPVAAHGSWGIILEAKDCPKEYTRLIDEMVTLLNNYVVMFTHV